MLKIFFAAFLLLHTGWASAQSGFRFNENLSQIDIPFIKHNNLIVLPVTIEDKLTLQFIVDTGVRHAILTEKSYADFLGLGYDRRVFLSAPGSAESVSALVARNVALAIPGASSDNQTLLVLEEDYLNLRSNLGFEVHGIIGYELFSSFVVSVNYDTNTITLLKEGTFKPRKVHTAFPITLQSSKPHIHVELTQKNGTKVKANLMVDTGASHGLLLEIDSDSSLSLPEKTLPTFLGKGLGGEIPGKLGRIDALAVGQYRFKDVIVSYPDEGKYLSDIRDERNGTIGGEIMTRFNPVFDYFNNTLYLRKSRKYGAPFEHDMSGMEFIAFGKNLDKIIITHITKDSPAAEAGLMVGDEIYKFNGYRMGASNFRFVNRLLRTKPGRKIRLIIVREETRMKIKFRLRQLI